MPKSRFVRLMQKLFRLTPVVGTDLVAGGNLAVACIAGVFVWLRFQASFPWVVGSIAFAFLLLTAFLLHRWTFWISLVLAGLVTSSAAAALFAGLGSRVNADFGGWVGGALGFALGVYAVWSAYTDFVREE